MAKVITIKPAEEIILRDPESNKEYHGFFNMRCLFFFQELLKEQSISQNNLKDYDLPAMCLYSVLNTEDSITYEDACEISKRIGPASGKDIINMFMESLSDSMSEKQRELVKKEMARYVMQLPRDKGKRN